MAGLLDKYLDPRVKERGAILPLARMDDGSMSFAWPGALLDVARGMTYTGDVGTGRRALSERGVTDAAIELAGGAAGAGLLAGPKGGATLGMNVWQGGPHKYGPEGAAESLKHIGKGEGAQAYGWGRYDAGAQKTGEIYRRDLSKGKAEVYEGGELVDKIDDKTLNDPRSVGLNLVEGMQRHRPHLSQDEIIDAAIKQGEDFVDVYSDPMEADIRAGWQAGLDWLKANRANITSRQPGYLYKHDLPDEDVAKYLDWDAPLSEQPASVKEFFKGALPQGVYDNVTTQSTGAAIEELWRYAGGKRAASEALRKAGIPGLKYYDGMSRGRGEGTRNYVTWDQDVLDRMKLLERNGEIFNMNPATAGPLGILNAIEQDRRNREWIKGGGA